MTLTVDTTQTPRRNVARTRRVLNLDNQRQSTVYFPRVRIEEFSWTQKQDGRAPTSRQQAQDELIAMEEM